MQRGVANLGCLGLWWRCMAEAKCICRSNADCVREAAQYHSAAPTARLPWASSFLACTLFIHSSFQEVNLAASDHNSGRISPGLASVAMDAGNDLESSTSLVPWPSGLRRVLQAHVRKGASSNLAGAILL